MDTPASRPSRGRIGLPVTIAFYALVLVGASFTHHDLACHLKSTTHCTSCTLTLTASGGLDGGTVPPTISLSDAGRLAREQVTIGRAPVRIVASGRSPPGSTLS
jgi:hypothetical protein